mmetsp:Transcript_14932/g.23543  ORF Transcript_14932/g.23543 Transcript_14932/m.23543 type:complete len:149 (-) Transcript_14932:163-609(-)
MSDTVSKRRPMASICHHVQPVEVDGFQVVHFSNYMRWYSGAMMAAFEVNDLGPGRFCDGAVEIRVGRAQVAYISSARLGDAVSVEVLNIEVTRNGLVVTLRAMVEDRLISRARISVAFVDSATGRLTKAPQEVADALAPSAPRVAELV